MEIRKAGSSLTDSARRAASAMPGNRLAHLRDGLLWAAAYLMPRNLVARATTRLGAEVTTGRWSSTVVPELPLMDALKRWEGKA